jgi:predicted DNA-binding transcriptional regulator YafY
LVGPEASVTPDLRDAIRKLTRALPEPLRSTAESASSAVVDAGGWDQPASRRRDPPLLGEVQQAVVEGRQVVLGYVSREGEETSRTVHPLGLAVKGASWYLLADTDRGRRTFRVDRVRTVKLTAELAERPKGFDLTAAWEETMGRIEDLRMPVRARAMVDPDMVALVRYLLGTRVTIGPPAADGRVEVELRGQSERSLAGEIAGLGAVIEVLEPDSLRTQLAEVARELTALYGQLR